MNFVKIKIEILVILMFGGLLLNLSDKVWAKRVKIHVPFKVRHHHHTHTVLKHVHHKVPVHVDHEDIHVIHPETSHPDLGQSFDYDDEWQKRTLQTHYDQGVPYNGGYGDSQRERELEYANFDQILKKKKRSSKKNNNKILNNRAIGWSGRQDFDKIANEYLNSLKRQKLPQPTSYEDEINFPAYTDDE